MKKNNALFIALTGASVVLLAATIADNITPSPAQSAGTTATEEMRQRFTRMGLPLHEGKYWKKAHE